jgi:son of sevenless-like protein
LVDAAWMDRKEKHKKSPQLLKFIEHNNMLSYWVSRAIVETQSLEERVAMFSRVLEVMVVFEELNNFNGMIAFYSALFNSSVVRLKESHKVCLLSQGICINVSATGQRKKRMV